MQKIETILSDGNRELKKNKIETSNLDSQILLSFILGVSKEYLIINSNLELDDGKINKYRKLIKRRFEGESISNITGKREFYGREFRVSGNVLDPRPETELIINIIKEIYAKDASCSVVDLGTGSACLVSTLLLEFPNFKGIGTDISEDAINIAQKNAKEYLINDRVSFIVSDWLDAIDFNQFDILISNPPYIPREELELLPLEVLHNDPLIALDGGIDGLEHYKKIASNIKNKNSDKEKFLIMEIYENTIDDLLHFLVSIGFERENMILYCDFSNRKRVIVSKF